MPRIKQIIANISLSKWIPMSSRTRSIILTVLLFLSQIFKTDNNKPVAYSWHEWFELVWYFTEDEIEMKSIEGPNALRISFKRFDNIGRKNGKYIALDEQLNLNNFTTGKLLKYQLTGIVVHEGSAIHDDHYILCST